MNVFDAALDYTRRGWCVVPIPHRSKKPVLKAWQQLRLDEAAVAVHFATQPSNVGVLLGGPSAWLVDIDLDHLRCVELADAFLPPTPAVFGRPGKPRSHRIYVVTAPVATKRRRSRSAGTLVELRSTGAQTVFPPSTHECGEAITWDLEGADPARVDPAVLLEKVNALADVVLTELGERAAPRRAVAPPPAPATTQCEPSELAPDERAERCLRSLRRLQLADHHDGSRRLYVAACRCVEHDLDDAAAIATIRLLERERPFPRSWIDGDVLQRLRDAEAVAERGAALRPDAESPSCVALGSHDPNSGRVVLSPRRTLPTSQAFVRERFSSPLGPTLRSFAESLIEWSGNAYRPLEPGKLRHDLQPWLHGALRYVVNRQTQVPALVPFESNAGTIAAAEAAIHALTYLPADTPIPSWLERRETDPEPDELLACRSFLLHLPTMQRRLATPRYFTTSALDLDHDPDAPEPRLWSEFLHQLFGDDTESLELLQEWIGYSLTPDTSLQKILLIVGPKRSGKGTIARVLGRLLGPASIVGPTTSSLSGDFGLQPLVGKSLAIVSDARFAGDGVQTVIERLLCISGEDTLTIDRKHLSSVTMKLPTRFMFLTNELPRLGDASGALAGRFMVLRLTESFYGREDVKLDDKLQAELPGILGWAIAGWQRLHARGHFVQPRSVESAVRDLEDLSSPVGAFVRDCCQIGSGQRVWIDDLYHAWKQWCAAEGRATVTTRQTFGKDLQAVVPGIATRCGTNGARFYGGIGLGGQIS